MLASNVGLLRTDVADQPPYFLVGNQHALRTHQGGRAGRKVEHITLSESFSAFLVKELPGCPNQKPPGKRSGWDVRFDDAGDDVGARRLLPRSSECRPRGPFA